MIQNSKMNIVTEFQVSYLKTQRQREIGLIISILVLDETFGQVPVILYKGEIIPESLIVCDFIDEVCI